MRPVGIRLEGFSAYRRPVEVDFADADFFSLTGPTGSGKSSLIDAMIFALYGRVPRLGGNAVAPAITAGADRARVAFEFEVGDDRYTAVRMAARTATGGASVREARLVRGDEVIASGADDVTTAVEALLRMRFDDFTRTVVLPQGEFARFLTATKAERQGLLRGLLGLDVYTVLRELARTRGAVATERAESAERALQALDLPDEESVTAARMRLDALTAMAADVTDREKTLVALRKTVDEARADEERLRLAARRLQAVEPPDRLEELASMTDDARETSANAEEAVEKTRIEIAETEAAVADLPAPERLDSWDRLRNRLDELDERLATADAVALEKSVASAEARLSDATQGLERTRSALASVRQRHAAHALTGALVAGEACPVCHQEVAVLPEEQPLPELDDLVERERLDAEAVDEAREEHDDLKGQLVRHQTSVEEITRQRTSVQEDLSDAPGPDEIRQMKTRLDEMRTRLTGLRETLAERETDAKTAARALEDLAEASRRIGRKLTEAQLSVADLEPELSESDDVVVQWKGLMQWRSRRLGELEPEIASAGLAVAEARATADAAEAELVGSLESHGIDPIEPYAAQVATALEVARNTVERHERAAKDSVELSRTREESATQAAVAATLAGHLRSNGFEQWLMAGALVDLVRGANDLLSQLSDGGYSLDSDDSGDFSIVDHRNADEQRSVSTLSGGETFLVSLALALSLAETLAAKGGSGLDAIILDEGFGSLDDDSLDTVASVLEELTGRGLMVGVITHVKDLAARAPVRFVVTREPNGATVSVAS